MYNLIKIWNMIYVYMLYYTKYQKMIKKLPDRPKSIPLNVVSNTLAHIACLKPKPLKVEPLKL